MYRKAIIHHHPQSTSSLARHGRRSNYPRYHRCVAYRSACHHQSVPHVRFCSLWRYLFRIRHWLDGRNYGHEILYQTIYRPSSEFFTHSWTSKIGLTIPSILDQMLLLLRNSLLFFPDGNSLFLPVSFLAERSLVRSSLVISLIKSVDDGQLSLAALLSPSDVFSRLPLLLLPSWL